MYSWQWLILIVRPHRNSTYVGAAYCYRPSSVVCPSVCLSVGLSRSSATQKPLNGGRDAVWAVNSSGSRNHVLDWDPNHPSERAILRGRGGPLYSIGTLPWAVRNCWTDRDADRGAHWRNLMNTIEPPTCDGDAAFLSSFFDHLCLLS